MIVPGGSRVRTATRALRKAGLMRDTGADGIGNGSPRTGP